MDATEFMRTVVKPTLDEFEERPLELRLAYISVLVVDAYAAHFFCSFSLPYKNDMEFRDALSKTSKDFRAIRDLSKALKHVRLQRGQPTVTTSGQLVVTNVGFGEGGYGEGPYGGGPQVVIAYSDGTKRSVLSLLRNALSHIESCR